MKKLLLHTCCGPCFLGSFEGLKNEDFEITNFYYNPNIQPEGEWTKRLNNLKMAARGITKEVIASEYEPEEHLGAIIGKERDFPARCLDCYLLRLDKTANYAKKNGFDLFSTTLLVSPYQQHEELKIIGETAAKKYGVPFYYHDLRQYFREGQSKANCQELYRQKYCGCIYSRKSE